MDAVRPTEIQGVASQKTVITPLTTNLTLTDVEFHIAYGSLVIINRRKVIFCTPHWKQVVLHLKKTPWL
jgi:hypothetical protein